MTQIEVRRSARRTRTIQARREGNRTIVMIPAHLTEAEEQKAVADMVAKLEARRHRVATSDVELATRAAQLAAQFIPEAPTPASVRWVTNQNHRWGSCTSVDRTIRLSHRLQTMPEKVIDAVLVHELAHLVESDHGPRFTALANRYPEMAWAMGFLDGVVWQPPAAP